MWDNFYDNLENEEFLTNHFEGDNDIYGVSGKSRSSGEEDITLTINEIDENAPLDEN